MAAIGYIVIGICGWLIFALASKIFDLASKIKNSNKNNQRQAPK